MWIEFWPFLKYFLSRMSVSNKSFKNMIILYFSSHYFTSSPHDSLKKAWISAANIKSWFGTLISVFFENIERNKEIRGNCKFMGLYSLNFMCKLEYQKRCNLLNNSIGLATRHFQCKIEMFFKKTELNGPLRKTKYYVLRNESGKWSHVFIHLFEFSMHLIFRIR